MPRLNLNILIAYPYFTKHELEALKRIHNLDYKLIIDSGAFSVWNSGKIITLDQYCDFLKDIKSKIKIYKAVQLDVFGNPKQTLINYKKMLDRGFTDIMPVFTRGDTLEVLEYLYTKTDYIMFGGIVIGGQNRNYIKWFQDQNKGRKSHWLGFCTSDYLKYFKPYSCDGSTGLTNLSRFGRIDLFDFKGNMKCIDLRKLRKKKQLSTIESIMLDKNRVPRAKVNELLANPYVKPDDNNYWYRIAFKSHILKSLYYQNVQDTFIYHATGSRKLQFVIDCYNEVLTDYKLETNIKELNL